MGERTERGEREKEVGVTLTWCATSALPVELLPGPRVRASSTSYRICRPVYSRVSVAFESPVKEKIGSRQRK